MTKFVELDWKIPPEKILTDGIEADRWTEVCQSFPMLSTDINIDTNLADKNIFLLNKTSKDLIVERIFRTM